MKWIAILLLALAACGDTTKPEPYQADQKVLDAAMGMVARHPNDAAGLEAAIEESDFFDTFIDAAIGQLVREGKIKVSDKGMMVVPREQWPVTPAPEED